MPKVSIIVPIYNVEKYLERCLNSLLKQTLTDIEIILVDDGSPDTCPQKCDMYAEQDSRIKVIHKENAGLGFARNSGLEIVTGEYVAFVDSDDYVNVTMYEKLYAKAVACDSDAVFCGLRRCYNNERYINHSDVSKDTVFEGFDIKNLALDFIASKPGIRQERKYEMSVWHSIYKLNLIRKNGIRFLSERMYCSEDLPFQIDFFNVAKRIYFIPDILYSYNMCNYSSLSQTFKIEKFYGFIRLYLHLKAVTQLTDPMSLRSKRLFIGYNRALCLKIARSNRSLQDKLNLYRQILDDNIWNEFLNFKYEYLPIPARIVYFLQRKQRPFFLYLFCKIVLFLKKRIIRTL